MARTVTTMASVRPLEVWAKDSRKAPQACADRLGQDGAGLATRGQGVIWAGQLRSEGEEAGQGREGPGGTLSVTLLGDCPRLLQQEDKAWRPKHKVWRCGHVSGDRGPSPSLLCASEGCCHRPTA